MSKQTKSDKGKLRTKAVTITLLSMTLILLTSLAACSSESKPSGLLKRFETANNERDVEKLLACYDPKEIAFLTSAGKGVSGLLTAALTGVPLELDFENAVPLFAGVLQNYIVTDGKTATIKLKEISTEMDGEDKAVIKYEETLVKPDGSKEKSEHELSLIKRDGEWYISVTGELLALFGL
ncbi:MAG: hypothetical protein LBD85_05625 [Oscillospiraceae bacterium]|jgi:hypothetical protein|nr:hypothetical protein [Oscillospiraceae bacterium]